MAFSPETFLSNIKAKDGLARPAKFEVILPIPKYINNFIESSLLEKIFNLPNVIIADVTQAVNDILGKKDTDAQSITSNAAMSRYLALQCESAELPGKTLMTMDGKVYGPVFKVPYYTQYEDMQMSFLCTNEFYERKLFERWIEAINPTDTYNVRFPKDEATRYLTNIKIVQYDDFIKKIFVVELIDAFPVGIAAQPLSWQDDNFHRLNVRFAYTKYKVIYEGSYDLVAAAAEYFGAKGSRLFDNTVNAGVSNILNKIF